MQNILLCRITNSEECRCRKWCFEYVDHYGKEISYYRFLYRYFTPERRIPMRFLIANLKWIVLLFFIILDLLSGIVKGIVKKKFSSSRLRKGLFVKSAIILLYITFYILDIAIKYKVIALKVNIKFAPMILTYIILMEVVSIIENCTQINKDLSKVTNKLKEEIEQCK